jgi:hypothetical protein
MQRHQLLPLRLHNRRNDFVTLNCSLCRPGANAHAHSIVLHPSLWKAHQPLLQKPRMRRNKPHPVMQKMLSLNKPQLVLGEEPGGGLVVGALGKVMGPVPKTVALR